MPSVSHYYIQREYELWDTTLPSSWTDGTAILSTGSKDNEYVDARDCNKLVLYFDVTLGSLTSVDVKVFFSDDASTWYQEQSASVAGGVSTLSVFYRSMTAAGQYRETISIMDRYVKIQVRGTGTVTGSNLTAKAFVGTV